MVIHQNLKTNDVLSKKSLETHIPYTGIAFI